MVKTKIISDIAPRKRKRTVAAKSQHIYAKVLIKDENEKNIIYHGDNHGVSVTPSKMQIIAHKMRGTMEQPLIYDTTFRHRPLNESLKAKSNLWPTLVVGFIWSLFVVTITILILAQISKY